VFLVLRNLELLDGLKNPVDEMFFEGHRRQMKSVMGVFPEKDEKPTPSEEDEFPPLPIPGEQPNLNLQTNYPGFLHSGLDISIGPIVSAPPMDFSFSEDASLYPDLKTFSNDNYLPKDYHTTIGRKYDLGLLANQLKLEREKQLEEEKEED